MKRMTAVVAGLSLAFVGTSASFAGTINVPSDQPTIAAAISASVNGDVINIAAGTYNEHSLNPGGKAITIQGTLNSNGSLLTTVDASQYGSIFVVESGEGDGTVIKDLVITGGSDNDGGGISCYSSSPTITDCTISGNTAQGYGGGIYCYQNCNPTITGCTIEDNTANNGHGGGIYCYKNCSPTITGCTISGNMAVYYGGGISCHTNSNPTISGCTFSGNTAQGYGGGIYCNNSATPTITGCRISGNTADYGGGIFSSGGTSFQSIITGSIICGNLPDQIHAIYTAEGSCIDSNCLFCPGIPSTPSTPTGACCLGGKCMAGTESDCTTAGGAYAGDDVACADAGCSSTCDHDIDGDGDTDIEDLLVVIGGWGTICP